ncbi:MAG: hypothetical protein QXW14_05865 [Candidatus Nitrosocaldus sp.]
MPILVMNVHAIETDQQRAENRPVKIGTDKEIYTCGKDEKVVVSISGNPNTTYTLVVTKPDNTTLTYTVTTNGSGSASVSIPLSASEPSGAWALALYDANKRVVAEGKFLVKCDNKPPPAGEPPMNPCLTVVSDTSTFVDRGNTVLINFTWPTPINGNDLGVAGAKTIWSSNGMDTNNPYTFTRHFLLPSGNMYNGTLTINVDDQWMDLKINGNFVASEPAPAGWGNVHTYDVSAYLQPGLNTLEVKAVDIAQVVAALAYKLEVKCKPVQGSTHWDKIIFTIDVKEVQPSTTQPGNVELVKKLRPLMGKTLDIKVRDEPSEVVALEDTVKAFLAAKYSLSKQDLDYITVRIVEVEYAIDPNMHGKPIPMDKQKEEEASMGKKSTNPTPSSNEIYYVLPPLLGIAGLGAFFAIRHRKV